VSWENKLVTALISYLHTRPVNSKILEKAIAEEFLLRGWSALDISKWGREYGKSIGGNWGEIGKLAYSLENKPRGELTGLERLQDEQIKKKIENIIPPLLFGNKFNAPAVADVILAKFKLKAEHIPNEGKLRLWMFEPNKKIWIMNPEKIIEDNIRWLVPSQFRKTHYVNETINEVASRVLDVNWKPQEEPAYLIPFKNCILDLRDMTTHEYSDEYFFVNKIDWGFKPELIDEVKNYYKSGSLYFDSLFKEWGQDPAALTALIGYTFYRDYPIQKAFFMVGEGSNGKGTYARIIQRILGKENCAGESLADLAENRFSTANLWSKFVNFSGEIHIENKLETSMLKQLTGGDLIRAEFKHKPPFTFVNYAKLIILGNTLPPTSDSSMGWFRRMEIIKWEKSFDRNKADPFILDSIPNEEWDKLVVKAVLYLKEMYDAGFKETSFPGLKDWEVNRREYEKLTNPFIEFIEKYIEQTENLDDYIPVFEFVDKFHKWILQTNHPQKLTWAKRVLNRKNAPTIVANFTGLYVDKKRIDENRTWKVIYGVKWRDKSGTNGENGSNLLLYLQQKNEKCIENNIGRYSHSTHNTQKDVIYYDMMSNNEDTLTSTILQILKSVPEIYLTWTPEQMYDGIMEALQKYDVELSEYAKEDILNAISEALKQIKGGVN